MKLKKTAIICLLCAVFVFTTCGGNWPTNAEFIFNNESSSSIRVYFDKPYALERLEEGEKYRKELYLSSGVSTSIYFYISSSDTLVDFRWVPNSLSNYGKIECIVDGAKATFKNR
jgi:hypothetical protein